MDGKLLVLCSERPTINETGDLKGHLLKKDGKQYFDTEGNEVNVEAGKRVFSAIDLLLPIVTPDGSRDGSDIFFVDWETVAPSNTEQLEELTSYAPPTVELPIQRMFKLTEKPNLAKRAYINRLCELKNAQREMIKGGKLDETLFGMDYGFLAMDDFLKSFSKAITNSGVVSILPAFSKSDSQKVIDDRFKILQAWKYQNDMESKLGRAPKIDIAKPVLYGDFAELREKASEEMIKIYSKPEFLEGGEMDDDSDAR